jgi:hypothetical protein
MLDLRLSIDATQDAITGTQPTVSNDDLSQPPVLVTEATTAGSCHRTRGDVRHRGSRAATVHPDHPPNDRRASCRRRRLAPAAPPAALRS